MKINRNELLKHLYDYSRNGNGLILGSPGSGKSYSLDKLRNSLLEAGIPALLIPVDRLGSATPADIKSHIGIDTTLSEKLKLEYNNTQKPAVLILDGFDAARNLAIQDNLVNLIKDLMSTLKGSWNILVSVRSFDAKKSRDLLKLFPRLSNADSQYTLDGVGCENFLIPQLTDEEVLSVKNDISGLEKLYSVSSEDFKEILRNPFNLWLLKKISEKNKTLDGIDKIGSEVQLLDKFWNYYISSTTDSESKEAILTSLTKEMVTGYSLSVRKDKHYQATIENSWKSLFSDEIIVSSELTGQRVAFTHNILFDYAVSRLVIDEDINEVVRFLTAEPGRALFLRPSLTYYYARLWSYERNKFWESFSTLLKSDNQNLRIFARLVPASVAVKLLTTAEDLDDLDSVQKKNPTNYIEIVTRLLQAYDFIGSNYDQEWLKFFKKLSLNIHNEYLWSLAKLTGNILDRAKQKEILVACGEIGRNLLSWIWDTRNNPNFNKNWLDGIGSNLVITIVVKTFSTNPEESEKIIREVLKVVQEPNFQIHYIFRLTHLMPSIWKTSPSLVGDIYRTVFSYEELSQEPTAMGTPVMPMTSNRKQDFQLCHYHLVQEFPAFIENAPFEAIQAGIDCVNAHIWQEHLKNKESEESKISFQFRDFNSVIIKDWSYIWDGKGTHREEQLKIASAIFSFIGKCLIDSKSINEVLDIFAQKASAAFWWKRLLNLGTKHPKELAPFLFELCLVEEIVDGLETEYEAVKFILAAWSFFTLEQKESFQSFLMALDSTDEIQKKYIVQLQEKIISKIPKETLTNNLALTLRDGIDAEGRQVENRPPYSITSGWGGPYTDEDYLKEQGTNLNDQKIKDVLSSRADLHLVTKDLLNAVPSEGQVTEILQKSKDLYSQLHLNPSITDKPTLNMAWTELANSLRIVVRSALKASSNGYIETKKMLLECLKIENPYPKENSEKSFTRAAYSHHAKTQATETLSWFARFTKDEEILEAIQNLAKDKEPEIRYLIATEIWRMREHNLEELWITLEERSKLEKNAVVLGALSYSLSNTFFKDHSRGEAILKNIYDSLILSSFSDEDIKGCLDIILWLHLENKSAWATSIISEVTKNPKKNLKILNIVVGDLLGYLLSKTLREKPNLFHAAKMTIQSAIPNLWKDVGDVYKTLSNKSSEAELEEAKALYQSIDNIVTRLYFAADVTPHLRNREDRALSEKDRKEFYLEIKPILSLVLDESKKSASATVFAPTAHHFMELISGVLPYDVSGVLKMAADLMSVSESSGYNLDSMAMSEVVKLTEATLADHRSDLQNSENITNLLKLLDSFAKTGWSDALRLVWRLDEIYR
jgi:hypothetical protein